jgi:hypothetical protein
MKKLQVKAESWLEFNVPDNFNENNLKNLKNMNFEELTDLTIDSNFETVGIEDWYEDIKFLGQFWLESDDDLACYDKE